MNPRVQATLREWITSLPPGATFDCHDAARILDTRLPAGLKASTREIAKAISGTPGVSRRGPRIVGENAIYCWRGTE